MTHHALNASGADPTCRFCEGPRWYEYATNSSLNPSPTTLLYIGKQSSSTLTCPPKLELHRYTSRTESLPFPSAFNRGSLDEGMNPQEGAVNRDRRADHIDMQTRLPLPRSEDCLKQPPVRVRRGQIQSACFRCQKKKAKVEQPKPTARPQIAQ